MKKKTLQKFSRLFASLVLVGAMSLGTVATANAATTNTDKSVVFTETETPSVALTVEYRMGNNVSTPKDVVSFTFSNVKKPEGVTVDAPILSVDNVTFNANEDKIKDTTVTDKKVLRKQSENFLINFQNHVNDAGMAAGVYEYTVKATSTITPLKNGDTYNTSKAEYKIYVYVAQKADKTGLYIKGIAIWTMKDDAGTAVETPTKVDGTPGTTTNGEKGNFSGVVFVDEYAAKSGSTDPTVTPNPEDKTTYAFKVTNTISGSKGDQSGKFSYTMNLKRPTDVGATETTYEYYVDGVKKTGTYGVDVPFELDPGKSMMVKSCYTGSTVTVTEKGVANWTASATPTFNNTAETAVPGQMGTDLTVANKTIGAPDNKVEFTNTYKDIAVTGIIVNNFPFVMMIVMAMAAFVAIVAVKSRRRMNER